MVTCTLCSANLEHFLLCTKCSKGFCRFHGIGTCGFCGGSFQPTVLTRILWKGKVPVEQLSAGNVTLGLVGFEELPTITVPIISWLNTPRNDSICQIFVIPDRSSLMTFLRTAYGEEVLRTVEDGFEEYSDQLRYSQLFDQTNNTRLILLNSRALSPEIVPFVLGMLFSQPYQQLPETLGPKRVLVEAVVTSIIAYNAKLGAHLIAPNEHTLMLCRIASSNLSGAYTDYLAIKEILPKQRLDAAEAFLIPRMNFLFDRITQDFVGTLDEVLNLFLGTCQLLALLHSLSSFTSLGERIRKVFTNRWGNLLGRFSSQKDLQNALNLIVKRLDNDGVFVSRAKHEIACSKAFKDFVGSLSPQYERLDEIRGLTTRAHRYTSWLENGSVGDSPEPNNASGLINLLDRIMRREDAHLRARTIAGSTLVQVLQAKAIDSHDSASYERLLLVATELSGLIESEYVQKSPLSFHLKDDIVSPLMSAYMLARIFQNYSKVNQIEREIRILADKHNIGSVKTQLDWLAFHETNDYNYLLQIYRRAESTSPPTGGEPFLSFVNQFASAIFEEDRRSEHFAGAFDSATDMLGFPVPHNKSESSAIMHEEVELQKTVVATSQSYNASNVSVYLVRLFELIYAIDPTNTPSSRLLELSAIVEILDAELSSIHTARTFLSKSRCILAMLAEDKTRLKNALAEIERYPRSQQLDEFVLVCNACLAQERLKMRVARSLETQIDQRDPWTRIALEILNRDLAHELRASNIFDFDSFVLVEGKSDAGVLQEFANKIIPDLRVAFVPVQGWTGMDVFANAWILSQAGKPVWVIFDGDTSEQRLNDIKTRLLMSIKIRPEQIITLSRRTIEDYLLVPRAIAESSKVGLKTVSLILARNKTRKNKKSVLRFLYKQFGVKYTIDIDRMIAKNMRAEEIDNEIQTLLRGLKTPSIRTTVRKTQAMQTIQVA